jgi:hypothetical protein
VFFYRFKTHLIFSILILTKQKAANAYIAGVPASNPYSNPYFAPGQLIPTILGPDPGSANAAVSQQIGPCVPQPVPMPPQQKLPRSDRIEVSHTEMFPTFMCRFPILSPSLSLAPIHMYTTINIHNMLFLVSFRSETECEKKILI